MPAANIAIRCVSCVKPRRSDWITEPFLEAYGSDLRVVLPIKLPFLSRNSRLVTVSIYHIRYC